MKTHILISFVLVLILIPAVLTSAEYLNDSYISDDTDESDLYLVRYFYESQHYEECINAVNDIVAQENYFINRYLPDLLYYRALSYFESGQYQSANKSLNNITRRFKHHYVFPLTLYYLGRSYYHISNTSPARERFMQYISEYPESHYVDNCYYWIAESYMLDGDIDNGIKYFAFVTNNFKTGNKIGWAKYRLAEIMGIGAPADYSDYEAALLALKKAYLAGIHANETNYMVLNEWEIQLQNAAERLEASSGEVLEVPENSLTVPPGIPPEGEVSFPTEETATPSETTDTGTTPEETTLPAEPNNTENSTEETATPSGTTDTENATEEIPTPAPPQTPQPDTTDGA